MKRIIIVVILFVLKSHLNFAQDGYTYIQLKGGYMNKKAMTFSVGFDFTKRYYSAYEVKATYSESFSKRVSNEIIFNEADSSYSTKHIKHAFKNLLIGVQYKPCIIRSQNTVLKARFGSYLGTDFYHFIASPNLGFELLQSLSPELDLLLTNNNGYFFGVESPDRWRTSVEIGVRLSL